jgi:hypothetical protein
MQSNMAGTFLLAILLGTLLLLSNRDHTALLHLVLSASSALILLYISRARAEYLWIGALGALHS